MVKAILSGVANMKPKCPNPKCISTKSTVEGTKNYNTIRIRYRRCVKCGTTWQTQEMILQNTVVVNK
jgi:aspartate carbamoyltransferase regulatory subunit